MYLLKLDGAKSFFLFFANDKVVISLAKVVVTLIEYGQKLITFGYSTLNITRGRNFKCIANLVGFINRIGSKIVSFLTCAITFELQKVFILSTKLFQLTIYVLKKIMISKIPLVILNFFVSQKIHYWIYHFP